MNSIRLIFYLSLAVCTSRSLPLPEGSIEIEDEDYPEYRLGVRYDEYPVSISINSKISNVYFSPICSISDNSL